MTETFKILDRFTGAVRFECEISADIANKAYEFQLGFAVKVALKTRANLAGANLARADLAGANLAGADLAGANLAGADLAGAYLARADLARANLAGANLAGAYLAGADLARANLAGADLARANLARANLAGANLAGADLAGAKWNDTITLTRAPLQVFGLAYPVTILDQHMQIGCELHTLVEWSAFDDKRIAKMDGASARRFWGAHGAALLFLAVSDGRGDLTDPVWAAATAAITKAATGKVSLD